MSEVPVPPELADQLREAHETYRHLVEGIPAVLYVDANDDHSSNIYTSPQIEPLLGFTVEQWRDDPALWQKVNQVRGELGMKPLRRG